MPLHLRDGIFVSLDHVIGFTKLFQESNEVLLGFTLEFTHKGLKLILHHNRSLMFIKAIRQRRMINDGSFNVGVTLLVALAMRHLAVMLSLGESKRDTRGVVAMAAEAMATDSPSSSSSSSSLYSSCTTNAFGGVF